MSMKFSKLSDILQFLKILTMIIKMFKKLLIFNKELII